MQLLATSTGVCRMIGNVPCRMWQGIGEHGEAVVIWVAGLAACNDAGKELLDKAHRDGELRVIPAEQLGNEVVRDLPTRPQ